MWFLVLLAIVLAFGLGAAFGAPYLPILQRDSQALLDLSGLEAGQTLIDLGSGDGRFLLAAARRGIHGHGYEINPFLFLVSRLVCWRYRKLVTISLANFWTVQLPPSDAVYIFLIDRYMNRLGRKLAQELKKPTVVVSYVFAIPGIKPSQQTRNAYRYDYPL